MNRSNYDRWVAADMPDLQYATKEACRDMSARTSGSRRRLDRLGRYLVGRPRLVWNFALQRTMRLCSERLHAY